MKIIFHPDALDEYYQTIAFYLEIEPKLGISFADEVDATINNIEEFPNAWLIRHNPNISKQITPSRVIQFAKL